MLARIVLASLVLELAAYFALGAWLRAAHAWSFAAVAALAIGLALGARAALLGFTSTVGWLVRSPREAQEHIGLAGTVRCLLGEYRALVTDNVFYLPWSSLAVRPDPVPLADGRMPVILVHGYLSNRGYFRPLVRFLEASGVGPVHTPDFPVVFTSIERFADELHATIERICADSGAARVALVCHSMGGLAAREYLRTHGSGRIAKLVTLASPHHGTALASIGLGLNARQMRQGSDFLRRLESAEQASPPQLAALSIYSPHDNLVSPQHTSRLPWARNLAIPGVGHIALLAAPAALAAVLEALR
jgi:pimeloyl-ACP methyl ester carboxylesterase